MQTTPISNEPEPKHEVNLLYKQLLEAWNQRNAQQFAALYEANGSQVGFDGSQMTGPAEIGTHLTEIFAHHQTGKYVGIVKNVQMLAENCALLQAVVGMIPHGQADLNPALNAMQLLVAVRRDGKWKIAHFQNTPAAFHGRPEEVERLTQELRAAQ